MNCNIIVKVVLPPNPDEVIDMLAQAILDKLLDERKNNPEKMETNTAT
ncbi:hypothetical protein [Alicyclobacillus fastidiosus]|uniref:Uncharacterized protein n=1 Tax=Alicyclobacillus fastidiosus TaxID=392011 RepID=A0ABV5AJ73_9BACL|nr:hypothetical protein [Alicyclobacillus fastidiosus]WEH09119.1 hypothetical protein PYS47_20980 [Alicyclobacillus fastidiosus]